MRFTNVLRMGVAAATLLFAMTAVAGSGSVDIYVSSDVQVNGSVLKAGEYQVKWAGEGSDVEVKFLRNGKMVATSKAALIDRGQKAAQTSTLRVKNGAGTDTLREIWQKGKTQALVLEQPATTSGN